MLEPVRPVVDGEDPLDPGEHRTRRGPIDPTLLRLAPALRRHLSICAGLAVATAVVVLVQAEIIGSTRPLMPMLEARFAAHVCVMNFKYELESSPRIVCCVKSGPQNSSSAAELPVVDP